MVFHAPLKQASLVLMADVGQGPRSLAEALEHATESQLNGCGETAQSARSTRRLNEDLHNPLNDKLDIGNPYGNNDDKQLSMASAEPQDCTPLRRLD